MKQVILIFLCIYVVQLRCSDAIQGAIDPHPTIEDIPNLLALGMYDQVAKVFNAQCKTQKDVDSLAKKYDIDRSILDLILGQSKNLKEPLTEEEKAIIEAAQGNTDFHLAVFKGDKKFVQEWLAKKDRKIALNILTCKNYGPLAIAINSKNQEMIHILKQAMLQNVDTSADYGYVLPGTNTQSLALHKTMINNKPFVCAILLILQICAYLL